MLKLKVFFAKIINENNFELIFNINAQVKNIILMNYRFKFSKMIFS